MITMIITMMMHSKRSTREWNARRSPCSRLQAMIIESFEASDRSSHALVVGKNDEWKQAINLGKRNNQNFVVAPFESLIAKLAYKCEDAGIRFVETEEPYSSRCSFPDRESIEHHDTYLGKRMKRGLFRTSTGIMINADVNGSYNILRKAFPNAFQQA